MKGGRQPFVVGHRTTDRPRPRLHRRCRRHHYYRWAYTTWCCCRYRGDDGETQARHAFARSGSAETGGRDAAQQKRSGVRDATIEKMAKRYFKSPLAAAAAAAVVVVFASHCCARAVGQPPPPPQLDGEPATAFGDAEDGGSTIMMDQLMTVRPHDGVAVYSTSHGDHRQRDAPVITNIQKVFRTAKQQQSASTDGQLLRDDSVAMALPRTADDGNSTADSAVPASASYTSDLEWLLNVYNPHRWNPVMLPAASKLSVQCRDVMKVYLEALRGGSFWAAKSESSRGRNILL